MVILGGVVRFSGGELSIGALGRFAAGELLMLCELLLLRLTPAYDSCRHELLYQRWCATCFLLSESREISKNQSGCYEEAHFSARGKVEKVCFFMV